jgi:secretion/DNA translocation related CpaE-like protein
VDGPRYPPGGGRSFSGTAFWRIPNLEFSFPQQGRSPSFGRPGAATVVAMPPSNGPARPLLVTSDADLLDAVLRLSAAAGVEVDVARDPMSARSLWVRAALVLLGDDMASACARMAFRRRRDVVVVGRDLDAGGIWQRAMGVGADHVAILPDAESWLIGRLADAADGGASRGAVVAVVGGRGGAGASTLAAALAVTCMRAGRGAMLIDADPLGGGVDLLFGGEQAAGLRWPDVAAAAGRIGADALRDALPCVGELAVLSWDRGDPFELPVEAMSSVLAAAVRACDLVVLDVPRRFDDAGRVALMGADVVLLLVPAEIRAAAAAARVAALVTPLADDVRLVVRDPAPGGLVATEIAAALGMPLAGHLRAEPDLPAALERGEAPGGRGRGPLARFCRDLLAGLSLDRAVAAVDAASGRWSS